MVFEDVRINDPSRAFPYRILLLTPAAWVGQTLARRLQYQIYIAEHASLIGCQGDSGRYVVLLLLIVLLRITSKAGIG